MKRMIKFLVLAAVLLVGSSICAQTDLQDVVHCKNGAIIKGTIVEQIPNEMIKIKTADGNVFVYKMDEIEKLTKEEASITGKQNFVQKLKGEMQPLQNEIEKSGFWVCYRGFAELGFASGIGEDAGQNANDFYTTHGIQFGKWFFLGAGIGMRYFKGQAASHLPLFGNMRLTFGGKKIQTFIDFKLGFSTAAPSEAYDDTYNEYEEKSTYTYVSPSIGWRFPLDEKKGVSFSIGGVFEPDSPWNKEGSVVWKVGFDF